ncbi:hypothetical protein PF010_g17756 [Phytophthora fragariae]|uniref:Uncharacterized protein n=1 Tax=Phytophthora fragariae TaxID=53985 RepID=A0A6G0KM61_9STRA|nr:hypothetical protein PF010_g17756 [Phytophthora fragariae]
MYSAEAQPRTLERLMEMIKASKTGSTATTRQTKRPQYVEKGEKASSAKQTEEIPSLPKEWGMNHSAKGEENMAPRAPTPHPNQDVEEGGQMDIEHANVQMKERPDEMKAGKEEISGNHLSRQGCPEVDIQRRQDIDMAVEMHEQSGVVQHAASGQTQSGSGSSTKAALRMRGRSPVRYRREGGRSGLRGRDRGGNAPERANEQQKEARERFQPTTGAATETRVDNNSQVMREAS